MIGLTGLEVFNSIFIINQKNNFELYTDPVDEFSEVRVRADQSRVVGDPMY